MFAASSHKGELVKVRVAPLLVAVVALLVSGLSVPASAARGDIPELPLAFAKGWSSSSGGFETLSLTFGLLEDLPPGTTVDIALQGCREGRARSWLDINPDNPDGDLYPFTYAEGVSKDDGLWGMWWLSNSHLDAYLGPDWTGVLSIARPGVEPWVWSFSHEDFDFDAAEPLPSNDDTCPPPRTPITVQKWSVKKGAARARVGKRLSVTPTRAPGSTVSYVWLVGRSSAVDRDRSMVVKKSYRGRKVRLKIAVSKPGLRPVVRKISYGVAR